MSYKFTPADPYLAAAAGAFNGYSMHGSAPLSFAALLKRRAVSSWHGIYVVAADTPPSTNYGYMMEFDPTNQLAADFTTANPFSSVATYNNIVDWMIVGGTMAGSGGAGATAFTWRYQIGGGTFAAEADTSPGSNTTALGAGHRHVIGVEAALGDDADFDMTCFGVIQSNLSQAQFESLSMQKFTSWKSVFSGSGALLLGFDDITTRVDLTGNGADEVSRSLGIVLADDPPGWEWQERIWLPTLSFPHPPLMVVEQ